MSTESPTPDPLAEWRAALAVMQAHAEQLREQGTWRTGPAGVLDIVGRAATEATHSRILAWLLAPDQQHGLGPAFLRALLQWIQAQQSHPLPAVNWDSVRVETEVARIEARADIVLWSDQLSIIIENKVYASEGPAQCARLARAFSSVRAPIFLFVTVQGEPPRTEGEAPEARFLALGYSWIYDTLSTLSPQGDGGPAQLLRDYLRVLARLIGKPRATPVTTPPLSPRAAFYLEHQTKIRAWAGLREEAERTIHEGLCSLAPRFRQAVEHAPPRRLYESITGEWCKLFWYQDAWSAPSPAAPQAAIGLEWNRTKIGLWQNDVPFVGVWVHLGLPGGKPRYKALQRRLRSAGVLALLPEESRWYAAKRLEHPPARVWEDLPRYFAQIVEHAEQVWALCAPLIAEFFQGSP